ncbi:hypothetical protein E2C01_026648 [Portunus trituberculatus]|uniref:Uncharacterized protein n=1 Tax=Portunus trituberculatus TaxID=210409 RepID=A0A5B7ELJ8_PORTR|nr:hypothetical protein [Portunus trituberculatus]
MKWEASDVMKERSPFRHRRRLSLRLYPESRKLQKSSAVGANPLIKAGHAEPEACWARSEEEDGTKPALPSKGKGCWAAGCGALGWGAFDGWHWYRGVGGTNSPASVKSVL